MQIGCLLPSTISLTSHLSFVAFKQPSEFDYGQRNNESVQLHWGTISAQYQQSNLVTCQTHVPQDMPPPGQPLLLYHHSYGIDWTLSHDLSHDLLHGVM